MDPKSDGFGDNSSSLSSSGGGNNSGIIAAAINAIATFFGIGAAKKANKAAAKTAEQQKAEALAIANASGLSAESLKSQKEALIKSQRDNLSKAIAELKKSSVKGWKDEISEMETKLKNDDLTTSITNLPHKGARILSKTSKNILAETLKYIDAFNADATKLLGVIVAMKDKGVADNDPVTNNTTTAQEEEARTASFQKYLPYVIIGILVIILFKRNQ